MRDLENHGALRRFWVIFVCLLIVLFVIQVKLAPYCQGLDTPTHPHNSSKFRIEVDVSKTLVPAIIVVWFAAAITYCLLLRGEPLVQKVFVLLVTHDVTLPYQKLFLRPPPVFAS